MEADRKKLIPQKGTDRPALKYLYRHVRADITGKWHDIGVELFDVEDEPVLNTIETNHPGDADKCTAKMLQLWRDRQPDASWNQLIQAFRAPNIKLENLASKIEEMLSEDSNTVQYGVSFDRKRKDDAISDPKLLPSSSAKKVKTTDGNDGDCSLKDDSKVDFEACNNVYIAFTKLYSRFQKAINALNTNDFNVIKNVCVVQAKEPLHSSLRRASNSHHLFEAFSDNYLYCNWINLSFLEIIANSYINDSLVNLINDYKKAIFSKSLREVWSSLPHSSVKDKIDKYYSELKQKLGNRNPDNMSVEELLDSEPQLTRKIALLFAVVREESLLITWLIPTDEVYQAYLSFLAVPQQERIDKFIQFGNWMAHLPDCVSQEEQKRLGILPASSVLIGYYHGLLLRDTNADSLIGHLCYNRLLSTHEQNVILSGHSLHCRNRLLLEYVRHMSSSSLMIFSKLVKDLWPQIGIQLVMALTFCDDDKDLHFKIHDMFNINFSYIDPSSVLAVFFQVCDSVVELLASCHVEVLVDVCDNLMASDKHFVKYFSDKQMKRLKDCDCSLLLLQQLSLFFTWSSHSILRVLADQCNEAVDILDNFDCRVNSFEPIASYPIPCFSLDMIPVDISSHTILAIKCDQALYECTLQYVYDMQSMMIENFDITQHCLQLLAVRSNPTIFYWTIPKCVVHLINRYFYTAVLYSEYLYSKGILELLVYPDLQFTFGDHVSVGLLAFSDDLVETKLKYENAQQHHANNKHLQETLERFKADKIALEDQLDDLNAKLQTLNVNTANKQLYEKLISIKLKNNQLNQQIEQLNSEKKDQLNRQKEQLNSESLEKNEHSKLQVTEKKDQLNKENLKINSELQENNHGNTQEYHANSKVFQETLERLKADKIALEDQLDDLNTKLQTLNVNTANKQLYKKLTNIKLEKNQLNQQIEQLNSEVIEIEKKDQLNRQKEQLNSELLEEVNKQNEQLNLKLQELTEKKDLLNKENVEINSELLENDAKLNILEKQNKQLKLELQVIKEKFNEVQNDENSPNDQDDLTGLEHKVHENISDVVAENLRDDYMESKHRFDTPNQPKTVVNVALMHYQGSRTEQELIEISKRHKEGTHAVDKLSHHSRITKDITKLFTAEFSKETGTTSGKPPKFILIEGAPGIGKTVLAKKIAYLWATKELLADVDILFLLFLRDPELQNIKTLRQFIQYISSKCLNNEQLEKCVDQIEELKVGIVMDGFDEYPIQLRKKSFIADIIEGKVFHNSIVVLTSRPTATLSLHDKVDRRVEILGFAQEERDKYISESLDSPEQRKQLQDYLKCQPIINGLVYDPLHLAILLYLFEVQSKLPETLTKMNESFILHTIYRSLTKTSASAVTIVQSLKDLPKVISDIVTRLSQLAFVGLQNNQLVFSYDEIKTNCPEITKDIPGAFNGFGLLQVVQHFPKSGVGATFSFNFLHFAMQEYLAALHVSNIAYEQQLSLMKDTFWNPKYNFMWMMYVGIIGVNSQAFLQFLYNAQPEADIMEWTMLNYIKSDKLKCLYLFQCFMEAKSKDIPKEIHSIFHNNKINFHGLRLLPHHVSSLTLYISKYYMQLQSLNLRDCHIGDVGMSILEHYFNANPDKASSIKHIDLFGNNSVLLWNVYCAIFGQQNLIKLNWSSLGRVNIEEIVNVMYNNTTVQSLNLSNNHYKDDDAEKIAKVLFNNTTLKELDLLHNNISIKGAIAISESLKYNATLQYLKMSWNKHFLNTDNSALDLSQKGMKTIDIQILANILFNNQIVIELNVSQNEISDDGALCISKCIKNNKSLRKLDLSTNGITDLGMCEIVSALEVNQTLQKIDVSHNDVSKVATIAFGEYLKINNTLQELNMSHNKVSDRGIINIAEALKVNTTLKVLDISHNDISDDGVVAVSDCLITNRMLKELNMSHNKASDNGIINIGKALKINTILNILDISHNDISDDGAVAISECLTKNNTLHELHLSWNSTSTTTEGITKLGEALKVNAGLHTLDLSSQCVDDPLHFTRILTALHYNHNMMKLIVPTATDKNETIQAELSKINEKRVQKLSLH